MILKVLFNDTPHYRVRKINNEDAKIEKISREILLLWIEILVEIKQNRRQSDITINIFQIRWRQNVSYV